MNSAPAIRRASSIRNGAPFGAVVADLGGELDELGDRVLCVLVVATSQVGDEAARRDRRLGASERQNGDDDMSHMVKDEAETLLIENGWLD